MNLQERQRVDKKRELAVALRRAHRLELRDCFDPFKPESRPNVRQLEILKNMAECLFSWVLGGNQSGKSQLGGRVVAWFFKRDHPYMDIDKLWPDEPIVIIVVGRVHNQVEELWDKKIKPFLDVSEWKENRQGGTLQYVVNPKNGSKIIFATHGSPETREKLQSYSAMLVWLDEMTDSLGILEELQRRVMAKRGRMLLTATPKIRAEAVKRFIEAPTAHSKVYRISMLDNPIYDDRRAEILSQIEGLPEAQRNTILYGDWYVGELAVFNFDPSVHYEDPPGYGARWPHVVCVDPAASGLMGFTLWAAPDKNAHRWWCVKAEYIRGGAPSDLVELVETKCANHNVIYRVFDSHEAWFSNQAAKMKIFYRGVPKKRDRKKEMIANLNQAFANGRIRIGSNCIDLASELSTAQWSETVEDKIVAASSYHLADCAQYFVDMMPAFKEAQEENMTHDTRLFLANRRRIAAEATRGQAKKPAFQIVTFGGKTWQRRG